MKKSFICEHCSKIFIPYVSNHKGRFCSKLCATEGIKKDKKLKSIQFHKQAEKNYYNNPMLCHKCSSPIPYKDKKQKNYKFCSKSCSASMTNTTRKIIKKKLPNPQKRIKNVWSRQCLVDGKTYYNKTDYMNREWTDLPSGKGRTIKLLANAFNIKLGVFTAKDQLSDAKQKINFAYNIENKSTTQIKKQFNLETNNITYFLNSIGIKIKIVNKKIKEEKYPNTKVYRNVCKKTEKVFYAPSYRKYHPDSITEKKFYYRYSQFKFSVENYPEWFDTSLIKDYGWYSTNHTYGYNLNGASRDHKISINFGYINGINPAIIRHPANCELLLHNDNIKKGRECSVTLENLLKDIEHFNMLYPNNIFMIID